MADMWMVKAGKDSFLIDDFIENNVVATGWNIGDLSNKSVDEIYALFKKKYKKTYSAKQAYNFVNEIKIDDYVITNNKETKTYFLGRIISDYYRSKIISKKDTDNDNYFDVHDVEWLCEIPKDKLKKSTQGTLRTQITVFNINDNAKKDILNYYKNIKEIKQIRTLTLSNQDPDCPTYQKTIDFLLNILINQRDCHFHYNRRPINLIGRTLVLFKYEGKLIAKGIFTEDVEDEEIINDIKYNGYYLVEKDSIVIFKESVGLDELKKYIPEVKRLDRDQEFDIKYLDKINQMIRDYSGEIPMSKEDCSVNVIKKYLRENDLKLEMGENDKKQFFEFKKLYAPDVLKSLNGVNVLNTIFPQSGNKSNLCYALEFSDEFKWFCGGIRGGSAFKFSLFKYAKTNKWTAGSAKSNLRKLTDSEAIELAVKIRDAIVEGADYIENHNLDSVEDYIHLEEELKKIFSEAHKDCPISPTHSWIHKYYSIIYPDKIPIVHADKMKKEMIRKFRIEPEEGFYANDGQLYELAKKVGINLYSLFDERIVRLFFESGSIWDPIANGHLVEIDCSGEVQKPFESNLKRNIIYFGAPGTGKSYNLNQDKDSLLKNYENNYERVTFHPDYSYANFVGTYKPVPKDDSITYKFVPGPFMRVLKKALSKPSEPFLLIIEEINRSNVAAVFGDVFQLLDREDNESMYPIDATEDMKSYLNEDKVIIPQNMFIWATMNSADQGVFPMDTAFKRRWDFKYFGINHNVKEIEKTKVIFNGKEIFWNDLRVAINKELLSYRINEDKLIGPFFAFNEFKNQEIEEETFKDIFKNKILMYLFEDAAKARRNDLFSGACDIKNTRNITYSEICEIIDSGKLIEIFSPSIQEPFQDKEE